jgi:hypothetical protein
MAGRSLKSQVAELSRNMRGAGRTWRDIAQVIEERYRVVPMLAFRLAHGWSQTEVAERYNEGETTTPRSGTASRLWRPSAPRPTRIRCPEKTAACAWISRSRWRVSGRRKRPSSSEIRLLPSPRGSAWNFRARRLDRALTSQYPDLTEAREFHERYRALAQAA